MSCDRYLELFALRLDGPLAEEEEQELEEGQEQEEGWSASERKKGPR